MKNQTKFLSLVTGAILVTLQMIILQVIRVKPGTSMSIERPGFYQAHSDELNMTSKAASHCSSGARHGQASVKKALALPTAR